MLTFGDCSSILLCAVSVTLAPWIGALDSKIFVIAAAAMFALRNLVITWMNCDECRVNIEAFKVLRYASARRA